nr:MAG TPA: hypothetical protein [Caudoviricetes sp.]
MTVAIFATVTLTSQISWIKKYNISEKLYTIFLQKYILV